MADRPGRAPWSGRGREPFLLAAAALLSAGIAASILTRHRLVGGLVALAGAADLVFVERSGEGTRSRFAGRVLDRVFEASILVPLAWVTRAGANTDSVLALIGLGASYLAAYQRAKGLALHYHATEAPAFLLTRYAILVLALLTGWLLAGLWVYVVVTVAAAGVQAWNVARQERRAGARNRVAR
jgi:hypothetical protein